MIKDYDKDGRLPIRIYPHVSATTRPGIASIATNFKRSELRSVSTDLGDGTLMHCWVPCQRKDVVWSRANAMWQYGEVLRHFTAWFDVYVPDLVFFGRSYTSHPERTVSFQAQCVKGMMERFGVMRMGLVGISEGGFVGYEIAEQFPGVIEKLVLCCSGVCLKEKDLKDRLFRVSRDPDAADTRETSAADAAVVREAHEGCTELFPLGLHTLKVMCSEYVEEKMELIQALLSCLIFPKSHRPHWGEQDQVFPLELVYRLKRHIGEGADLVWIKNAGHAVNLEKPREFIKQLKLFLLH